MQEYLSIFDVFKILTKIPFPCVKFDEEQEGNTGQPV